MKKLVFKTLFRYLKELSLFLIVYVLFLLLISVMLSYSNISTDEVDALYGNYVYAPADIYEVYDSIHPWGSQYILVFLTPILPILIFFQDYFLIKLNIKELVLLSLKGVNSRALYFSLTSFIMLLTSFTIYPLYMLVCLIINNNYDIGFEVIKPDLTAFIYIGACYFVTIFINFCLLTHYFSDKKVIAILRDND